MKRISSLILCFFLFFSLCACTSKENEKHVASTAVVYFSVTHHTQKVARKIQKELNCDIYEIQPEKAYTKQNIDYTNDSCRANVEQKDENSFPKIKNDLKKLKSYDTIYLGYPIWWSTHPRIIETLLSTYDLSHANLYLFCTSGGSDISTSEKTIKKEYPKLHIVSSKRFDENQSVTDWIKKGK